MGANAAAPDRPDVIVAGGGIAGITVALRLARRGRKVTLYEEKKVLGGNLASGLPAERIKLQHAAADARRSAEQLEERAEQLEERAQLLEAQLEERAQLVQERTELLQERFRLEERAHQLEQAATHPLDVYPHMYQAWYRNFWNLLKAARVQMKLEGTELREVAGFKRFSSFHQLRKKEELRPQAERGLQRLATLTYPYSARYMLENLSSGVAAPADMFAMGYASIDLQAELMRPTVRLQNMSLTGYLNSRRYLSKAAIEAYETFITTVWGLPAYLISAAEYRAYAAYCYGAAEEYSWLTSGPASEVLIAPLQDALRSAHVDIKTEKRVCEVICTPGTPAAPGKPSVPGRVSAIKLETTHFQGGAWRVNRHTDPEVVEVEDVDLVLAIPPKPLANLVRRGKPQERITDALPGLRELTRVQSERIPMLHLALKTELKDIPSEPVSLAGSQLKLAFTDISKTWEDPTFSGRTVLAVSCSEPSMLPGAGHENSMAIIRELQQYLEFSDAQVDSKLTQYRENDDVQLSLNTIGTDTWRPEAHFPDVKNLFFAGDFCKNNFGVTTVEAAVATGLAAANEVVKKRNLGTQFPIETPNKWPVADFVGMRYAWLPFAYAARAASKSSQFARPESNDSAERTLRYLLTPGLRPDPDPGARRS